MVTFPFGSLPHIPATISIYSVIIHRIWITASQACQTVNTIKPIASGNSNFNNRILCKHRALFSFVTRQLQRMPELWYGTCGGITVLRITNVNRPLMNKNRVIMHNKCNPVSKVALVSVHASANAFASKQNGFSSRKPIWLMQLHLQCFENYVSYLNANHFSSAQSRMQL